MVMFLTDGIEALVGLGQLDRAEHLTGMLEHAARRLRRDWALAQADRCRDLPPPSAATSPRPRWQQAMPAASLSGGADLDR